MGKSPLLDFKKFKHVKSDDKTTTLQHDDGHVLQIAHNVLSKDNQAQLMALAKASQDAPDRQEAQDDAKKDSGYGKVVDKSQPENTNPGKVKMMADGGDVDQDQPKAPDALQSNDTYNQSHPQQTPGMPNIILNIGGQPQGNQQQLQPIPPDPSKQAPAPAEKPMAPDTSTPMGRQQLMIDATKAGMNVPDYLKSIGAPAGTNVDPMQGQQTMIDATREGKTVPQMNEDNAPAIPQAQAPAAPDSVAQAPETMPASAPVSTQAPEQAPQAPKPISAGDSFAHQVDAVKQDFDMGHITPKTYSDLFADKSTLGKIGTIFAMMVGSAGAGLSHQPNMLLGMMDKIISNDLDAQKQTKSNQMNFMKLAEDHTMNQANIAHMGAETATMRDALAQQYAMRSAFHQLSLKAQAMPEGPAKQQAMSTLGMMSQGIDAKAMQAKDLLNAKQALSQGLMGAMNSDPGSEQAFQAQMRQLRMTGHEDMAKDIESKYVPGLGRASVPLAQADREKIMSGLEFGGALKRFTDFAKANSGSLDPKVVGQGKALAAELQGAYRNATNGGVYKESEQGFIGKIIHDDPTAFFNKIRVLPSLNAVAKEHDAKMNTMTKAYGFQNQMPSSQGPEIKTVNGMQYQKVSGGWSRVK